MSHTHETHQTRSLAEKAVLVACHLPESRFDPRDPLGELRALTESAGASVVGESIQNRKRPDAGTYIGKGKVDEIKAMKETLGATLIIFDNDLSPAQIRNLEQAIGCKIIDRSELILDIFANRATTNAARLQVELAQLEYTYPRLRAMWSHLGQITGGAPVGIGTRGPGETQIEIDRRLVQRRKAVLKARIAEILERRAREVRQRNSENRSVCLVGYTNAGKSTLFNALTEPSGGGGAYADDRVFATLTTRTRAWPLGQSAGAMLSDTVGFVRDLPHHLVASFRATLEEALNADLLLVVLDVSDPLAEMQYDVVNETLDSLLEQESAGGHVPARVLVLNKMDRLTDATERAVWQHRDPQAIAISAVTGEGLEALRQRVLTMLEGQKREITLRFPFSASRGISQAERRGEVLERTYADDHVLLRLRIGETHLPGLLALGGAVVGEEAGNPDSVPVHEWQLEELRRRRARHETDPGEELTWEQAKQRVRNQLRKDS